MGKNKFPGGQSRNGFSVLAEECRKLHLQVQHLSCLLWLSLDQNGDLIVDAKDMAAWPKDRFVKGQKIPGTEKVAWSASQTPTIPSSPCADTATGDAGCKPQTDPQKSFQQGGGDAKILPFVQTHPGSTTAQKP